MRAPFRYPQCALAAMAAPPRARNWASVYTGAFPPPGQKYGQSKCVADRAVSAVVPTVRQCVRMAAWSCDRRAREHKRQVRSHSYLDSFTPQGPKRVHSLPDHYILPGPRFATLRFAHTPGSGFRGGRGVAGCAPGPTHAFLSSPTPREMPKVTGGGSYFFSSADIMDRSGRLGPTADEGGCHDGNALDVGSRPGRWDAAKRDRDRLRAVACEGAG